MEFLIGLAVGMSLCPSFSAAVIAMLRVTKEDDRASDYEEADQSVLHEAENAGM